MKILTTLQFPLLPVSKSKHSNLKQTFGTELSFQSKQDLSDADYAQQENGSYK